ncbi:MAG: CBS domain-containing protein [Candidatus Aenigmarchaeota archaeon]|nr:CBS domain-containing protein [Candidatus Aenigmarchaeota archaeon]
MVKVKEVMKKHVVTIGPEVDMYTVAKILTNNRIGCAVIVQKDIPTGIVTTNDIVTLIAKKKDPQKIKAGEFWKSKKRPFESVNPNQNILNVTKKMIKTGIKRFPVVDKDQLKGIISVKEILLVSPELIEILSEKLKSKVESVVRPDEEISGICENCDAYSDELVNIEGRWICPDCTGD